MARDNGQPGLLPPGRVAGVRADVRRRFARLFGRFGLSGKLLALTVLFVLLAEVVIFVPSIANFRSGWLNERLARSPSFALKGAVA